MHKCLTTSKAQIVLKELCEKVARKYFATYITTKKKLDAGYWWPTLFKDTHEFCRSWDSYQKIGKLKTKSLAKLVTTLPEKAFMKWGLDFIHPIKLARSLT
jgi:hypothetical protein